ncbi:protein-export chaperone SecB [Candidatus Pelagibacter communis]|uniref:protein-export chaperone SecB n=1 Tax=Pelagibacter ubique TaxID=198252 RepID=UPI0009E19D6C|nr:protein-export chaperone SecB [Candidatus Pelagibacter ubique]
MTKNYKILAKFIRDMSVETADIDTYLHVKDNISNYSLNIDIKSKFLKDKIVQVETTLTYSDKGQSLKKSLFEVIFATVIKLNDEIKDKKDLGRIILCDLQNEIYPELEKTFLNVLHGSGYPELTFNKKVDFEELYKNNQN